MANQYTRRQFFKGAVGASMTVAGAVTGGAVAKRLTDGMVLEKMVDVFYRTTYDTLAETTGAAERRLAKSVRNLKSYIGETQKDANALQKYWDNVGLATPKTFGELEKQVKKMEYYVEEADFGERMERLKDRLVNQGNRIDEGVEASKPGCLQAFDEYFSKLIKGEKRGSKVALDKYKSRLSELVDVYDVNRDNVVAQAALLGETKDYFVSAQKKVVAKVGEYVKDPKTSKEERAFYEGLVEISKKDSSGRDLADYLLKTDGYFRTIGVVDGLEKLSSEIKKSVHEIKSLQELMDEGLALKDRIRKTGEVYPQMVKETRDLISGWEEERDALASNGHEIDYDLYPSLTNAKDGALSGIRDVKTYAKYAGMGVGGVVGAWVSGIVNRVVFGSDRRFGKKVAGKLAEAEERIRVLERSERNDN